MDRLFRKVILCVMLAGATGGCIAAPDLAGGSRIDFSVVEPLPPPAVADVIPLRVAVAAVISPQGTAESYLDLLNYLEVRLNRPVELVQRASYEEINDLIELGEVDIAFVCTGAYLLGVRDFEMRILAVPEINGGNTYQSWVIVPAASAAERFEDLRGATFAFTDPLSNTGRLYPLYLLQQRGETPESYFARTFFTFSHDAAIQAVASGLADGAAVDNLIFEYLLAREPELAQKVRIIHRSTDFGIPPVVVNPNIRPQLYSELQGLLLAMDESPEGRRVLETLGIDRFVVADDSLYESAREIEQRVLGIMGGQP